MKANQAWGWLAAGVLAAGLNANYYDGGFRWAHGVADRVGQNSAAVLALASGQADQFLSEAKMLTGQNETVSCPLGTMLTRVQTRIAHSQPGTEHFHVMAPREQAQLAKLEANRAKMDAQAAHFRIATAAFAPAAFRAIPAPLLCPRVRVSIPQVPMIKLPPMPVVHIETASTGPV